MVACRRASGFTLIELTIAIVLLTVGLLTLTAALARALHATTHARVVHAALRDAEGVADSMWLAGVATPGARNGRGYRLEWDAADCALGRCVRVRAITGPDTAVLVMRIRS